MDLRNNLFSKPAARGGAPGLPGRQVQRPPGGDPGGYSPAPSGYGSPAPGYGSPAGRSPAPAPAPPRQQNPPGGGYGGDGYAKESYGGAGYGGGYGDAPGSYQPPSRSRQVRLRIAKVEDKTLQSQYIFGNM
jgi:vesicle-fusing ATPase